MRQNEESHIMDNVIYNDLIQRGCSVDVGVVESFTKGAESKTVRVVREIDFVQKVRRIEKIMSFTHDENLKGKHRIFYQSALY
ncbi:MULTISPECIES: hypothetical protein [Campylobacter]|uniref:Uncharacterized protein n=1 Tax=Campylobacter vicugnae TaxID=1660076 RepID=A0ABZ2E9X9_9BACT|nr:MULTISPECIES: hypothetical protein [unclassified Campylobacter]MCR8689911.1 hypothetical protein [Campylobacter sp. RM9264]MCR8700491.1 hypothetical protein [Campylobacter sp. RM12176]